MKSRVTYIYMGQAREPGACEIYRGNQPVSMLNEHSKRWEGGWIYLDDFRLMMQERGPAFVAQFIAGVDVFVFARVYVSNDREKSGLLELINIMRELGCKIVYETDDDYSNVHRKVIEGDAVWVAEQCDAIIVTGKSLAGIMTELVPNKPVFQLPNCVSPEIWKSDKPSRFKFNTKLPVVLLSGSSTHKNDWMQVSFALNNISKDGLAHVAVMGYHPDYLDYDHIQKIKPMHYLDYAEVVKAADIILAPVNEDPFNLGKSPIKAVEGMAAGKIVIATDNDVYRSVIKDGYNGFLVENWDQYGWKYNIENALIQIKEEHMEKVRRNAGKTAWNAFDASTRWVKWEKVLKKIKKIQHA